MELEGNIGANHCHKGLLVNSGSIPSIPYGATRSDAQEKNQEKESLNVALTLTPYKQMNKNNTRGFHLHTYGLGSFYFTLTNKRLNLNKSQ